MIRTGIWKSWEADVCCLEHSLNKLFQNKDKDKDAHDFGCVDVHLKNFLRILDWVVDLQRKLGMRVARFIFRTCT